MADEYFEDLVVVKQNFTEKTLEKGTYEGCSFEHCIFNSTDISTIQFLDCNFESCDLSLAIIKGTAFRDVKFKDCKMQGLHFEDCSQFLFDARFENCNLNHSTFYNLPMKNTFLKNCSCKEVDWSGADLTGATFDQTDLYFSKFDQTNLEKADLSTAYNFSIDPEKNKIKKAKFSIEGLAGLLGKYDLKIK